MISVIVPVYNVERYIKKCIESIINQTYKDIEIILVDDGSKDNSGIICDEYVAKDSRIKVIHKENGGLSDARNCGIDVAKGAYFVFVDSDDYIHTQMIEILYKALKFTDAEISVCNFMNVSEDELVKTELVEAPSWQTYTGEEKLAQLYIRNLVTVVAWNKLYSRRLFETLRYPKGRLQEDEFVIHRLLYAAKAVTYVDAQMYYYVQRNNSIMGSVSARNVKDGYDALLEREQFWEEKGEKQAYTHTLVHRMYHASRKYYYIKEKRNNKDLLKLLQQNIGDKIKLDSVKQLLGKENYIMFIVFQKSPRFYKWYGNEKNHSSIPYKIFRRIFWRFVKF